ncbi:MAG TPA: dephospho-CoA kinase [Frateuria sp.]|uniref:dephospho-CoA kinase n=1 Tax=Frateuria sp. TaxID=2211372 RepID=UPI002DE397F1|nr:dephospho-CoA kinase [Frateuria sp.]HEV2539599.1 dephospho-CoA kinase [Frateuria sp.]
MNRRQAYAVGLTGGIAAGKTAVARRFEALGVPVHDADVAARAVVEPGSEGLAAIVAAFGAQVLDADGRLDRPAMRRHVFADAAAKQQLEAIVHPRVREWLHRRVIAETAPYCLLVIPLLAENMAHYRWLDRILLVDVTEAVQIERLCARDGIDRPLAERMLAHQASRAERLALADDIIDNSGSEAALEAHVQALHRRYLALAAGR